MVDLPCNMVDVSARMGGMSAEDLAINDILTQRIVARVNALSEAPSFRNYFTRLNEDTSTMSAEKQHQKVQGQIQRKKKLLFVLETAGVDWNHVANTATIFELLRMDMQEGMVAANRCPDGINAYCDQYISKKYNTSNAPELVSLPPEVSNLICAVANFVHHYKALFIQRHLSRKDDDYEGRTSGPGVLTNMLLMPLALPGEYSPLLYPGFARRGLKNPADIRSDAVCRRFITGGLINFTYGAVDFPALTLANFITAFKGSIVKQPDPREGARALQPILDCEPGLQPKPILGCVIEETVLEDFIKNDIAIGPFYAAARELSFTTSNVYFCPLPESPSAADATRPLIVQVLRDAGYVRLLQVCKLVRTQATFEADITTEWVAETMPNVFTSTPR